MNMSIIVLILLLVHNPMTETVRVRERFKLFPRHLNATIAFPEGMAIDTDLGGMSFRLVEEWFKGINMTIVNCGQGGIGRLIDENGSIYDGMIGCVQRNETNTMIQFARYDVTPFEPGIFVTCSIYADTPKMYTKRPNRNEPTNADILILWTNFEIESWEYLLISFILSLFVWIFLNRVMESNTEYGNTIKTFLWLCFGLKVQQFDLNVSKMKSCTILIFALSISILYGYHYVLFNTLSSDLTVTAQPHSIDSLNDLLYDPENQNVTPRISSMFNMYSTLSRARDGTDEHKLFERIMDDPNDTILSYGSNGDMNKLLKNVESMSSGTSVYIESSKNMRFSIRDGSCFYAPDIATNIMATKELILPSPTALLLSKDSSIYITRLFEYRALTLSEFGTQDGLLKTHSASMYESLVGPPKDPIKVIICQETFDGTRSYEDLDIPWQPFKLEPFRRAIKIYLTIIVISILVLIVETKFKSTVDDHEANKFKWTRQMAAQIRELYIKLFHRRKNHVLPTTVTRAVSRIEIEQSLSDEIEYIDSYIC